MPALAAATSVAFLMSFSGCNDDVRSVLTGSTPWLAGSTPWKAERVSPDGRTIELAYNGLTGTKLTAGPTRVIVKEDDQRVQIAVHQEIRVVGDGETEYVFDPMLETVRLKAPLADRKLEHAPVSPELEVLYPGPDRHLDEGFN